MNHHRRIASILAVVVLVATAGCGGQEAEPSPGILSDAGAGADARASGNTQGTSARVVATPSTAERNAPMTISFYPGSYANQMLFVKWLCYQDGALRSYDGSFELRQAVSQGLAGYAYAGDHYDWTFIPSDALNDALLAGPATCSIEGWYENRKLQWFKVATGSFVMN